MPAARQTRHERTAAEIVDAAWKLAAARGLAGFTLRDMAADVGMRAPSLYSYFGSKASIYDAMFIEGNRALMDRQQEWAASDSPTLHEAAAGFVEFCTENPTRYQLLFQRVIPGWHPSATAYASAVEVYDSMRARLAQLGVREAKHLDLWTALLTGLTDQQISNDPGGNRWSQLVDDAVDMFIAHTQGATS
ncbi:MAG: TetR/AcrR family transcriptional regulator [Actinomycetes bacterium]